MDAFRILFPIDFKTQTGPFVAHCRNGGIACDTIVGNDFNKGKKIVGLGIPRNPGGPEDFFLQISMISVIFSDNSFILNGFCINPLQPRFNMSEALPSMLYPLESNTFTSGLISFILS
jgi:hypothetical protein